MANQCGHCREKGHLLEAESTWVNPLKLVMRLGRHDNICLVSSSLIDKLEAARVWLAASDSSDGALG